ncbi:OsmC family protein [Silicimonas algicola]|uniref:Putative redox protein n=1 Tax=Silicimonas algicola TaxID=1826607 RepID=A0A316FZW1_9RHOB|nr:OsmC family protein [Silicimonas algicola]AZQ69007.1 OsmC family protein [Silicimonas algicola]PWK54109.1 putative redox protein [Silicimonas algicola]
MKSTITWLGNKTFTGQTESGHSIVIGTADGNAPKPGPSAMELVLLGAGSCSAWDVVEILKKGRQQIEDVIVELDADRAPEPPKVFTRIHMHFVVKGRGLSEERVKRAIDLSVEKYCSATMMLEKTATVTHDFEVVETA